MVKKNKSSRSVFVWMCTSIYTCRVHTRAHIRWYWNSPPTTTLMALSFQFQSLSFVSFVASCVKICVCFYCVPSVRLSLLFFAFILHRHSKPFFACFVSAQENRKKILDKIKKKIKRKSSRSLWRNTLSLHSFSYLSYVRGLHSCRFKERKKKKRFSTLTLVMCAIEWH